MKFNFILKHIKYYLNFLKVKVMNLINQAAPIQLFTFILSFMSQFYLK